MLENSKENLLLRQQKVLGVKKYGSSLEKYGKNLQQSDRETTKQCGQLVENLGLALQEYAQASLLYLETKTLDGLIAGYGKAAQAQVKATNALLQAIAISKSIETKYIEIMDLQESIQQLQNPINFNSVEKTNIIDFYFAKKNANTNQIQEYKLRIEERQNQIKKSRHIIKEWQNKIQENQHIIEQHKTQVKECQHRIEQHKTQIARRKRLIEQRQLSIK